MSNPDQAPVEAAEDLGVFERAEMTFRRTYFGQLAAIAVAAFGVASAAEAYTAEPAAADNIPAATSQQECITDASGNIDIRNAQLTTPNKSDSEEGFVNFTDNEMPANCSSQFNVERDVRDQFLVEDPVHRAKWVPFAGVSFKLNDYGVDGAGGLHTDTIESPAHQDYNLYECTPGPQKTGAKVEVEEIPENAQTEQPLAKPKVFTKSVEHISPKPC